MIFFGIVFVIYVLILSGTSGFWKKLQETDNVTRKMAIIYQKLLLKVDKSKMDLNSLYKYKNENVYPKFARWKHVKNKPLRIRKHMYQKNLENAIEDKHSKIKEIQSDLQKALSTLDECTTWMKRSLIKFSINRLLSNKLVEIQIRHDRKFNNLIMEKQIQEGITKCRITKSK